ncbi:MAG: hypothetical protein AB7I38_17995 [Dehalococcoidia bacterium]
MLSSLGPSIIAATAALIGVLMGNLLQSRRERSRWNLDRQAQRQRDHELWGREDRHRFTEHKRDLYARFLSALARFQGSSFVNQLLYEADLPDRPTSEDAPRNKLDWLFGQSSESGVTEVSECLHAMSLVAPDELTKEATRLQELVASANNHYFIRNDHESGRRILASVDASKLRQYMRDDLAAQVAKAD